MTNDGDDDIPALSSDPVDLSGGPIGSERFRNDDLAEELRVAAERLAEVPLSPAPWLRHEHVVARITPNPTPVETRSTAVAADLIEIVHLDAHPPWMDGQVNVRAHDGVLSIEVAADEQPATLWAVIDVLGEPLGAEFFVDLLDDATRTARLPLAVVRGQEIQLALQPSR